MGNLILLALVNSGDKAQKMAEKTADVANKVAEPISAPSIKGAIAIIVTIMTLATLIFAGGHYLDIIGKGKYKLYIELIGALAGLIAVIGYLTWAFIEVTGTAKLI